MDFETRLYVEAELAEGAPVALTAGQLHQLRTVRRLESGAAVALFNGRDGEWLATLRLDRKTGAAQPVRRLRAQTPPPDLWLLFAPLKSARLDFLVEKAAELGVSRLLPVMTERTQAARVNVQRLWENAREAAEQCERLEVPELAEPARLGAVLAGWDPTRRLFLCAERGEAEPAARAFGAYRGPAAILTGPEGGFSPGEFEALRSHAFATPVGLGPRILRAETAALAALACRMAIAGDWVERVDR